MNTSLFRTHMISRLFMVRIIAICAAIPLLGTSCVHECPENKRPLRDITLTIRHQQEWTQTEMTVTREGAAPTLCRYHLRAYPAGSDLVPVAEFTFFSGDISRGDFTVTIQLSEGDYDLYCWSDYADAASQIPYFFDSSDFHNIIYSEPYNGNNELRDAFRGNVTFSVESTLNAEYHQDVELMLERPFARYEFRATDIRDFVDREITRGGLSGSDRPLDGPPANIEQRLPSIKSYRVKMIYPGYMPSKFDNLLNRPVDSATGMSYDAEIRILSEDEARLGFDHVMVNGHESSIAVAMEVYDPDGELIGRTSTINVPTKRGRNTIVRGRFLTSQATGGVGIDPSYDGDYNVRI